jgi:predicted nucleic acid-binding protein
VIRSLDQFPSASEIFIDSNIFLYDILGHPRFRAACIAFLEKIEAHIC